MDIYAKLITVFKKDVKDIKAEKIYFITYGDQRFKKSKKRLTAQAKLFDFDYVKAFGFNDISADYIIKTEPFIRSIKGGGFWLWKPYIFHKTFHIMKDGDVLLYLDAGFELNIKGRKRFFEYIDLLDNNKGVLSFYLPGLKEKQYTNNEVFRYFEMEFSNTIYDSFQMVGGCILLRKNELSKKLIDDFFDVAVKRPDLFSDVHNDQTKREDFISHRHDQSVFSVLRKKYGLPSIEDETYNNDFSLIQEYPFLAKRIRDKKSIFQRLLNKVTHKLKNHFLIFPFKVNKL